jgi:hypothetical protein
VGDPVQRERSPGQDETVLQDGDVKPPAVEGHQEAESGEKFGQEVDYRRFVTGVAQERLQDDEAVLFKKAQADQEGHRPRAAGETGGLCIQEEGLGEGGRSPARGRRR